MNISKFKVSEATDISKFKRRSKALISPISYLRFLLRQKEFLRRRFKLSVAISHYISSNKEHFQNLNLESNRKVLIARIDGYGVIDFLAHAGNYFSQERCTTIEHYTFESQNIYKKGLNPRIPNPVLDKIYASFGSNPGVRWNLIAPDTLPLCVQSWKVFRSLTSKEHLLDLKINRIPAGSLIYDTYLRRSQRETVDLESFFLLLIIFQAFLISKRINRYLENNEVEALFPGDVAYIYSGIVARAAILHGIPTYVSVASPPCLIQMNSSYVRHRPYWQYRQQFSASSESENSERRNLAAKMLEKRLQGEFDANMTYMQTSTFSTQRDSCSPPLGDQQRPKILVLLHDFFDSPHIYRNMIFPDFWEWICFTLQHALNTPYDWYVKPHPNGMHGNQLIIDRLRKLFPSISFIPPETSNQHLVQAKIKSVFSVYGSCGHEFPYLGIPVVMAGDNPHVAWDFTLRPRTKKEYEKLIYQADNLPFSKQQEQIQEFYYMHYCANANPIPQSPNTPSPKYISTFGLEHFPPLEQRMHYQRNELSLIYFSSNRSPDSQEHWKTYFNKSFLQNQINQGPQK